MQRAIVANAWRRLTPARLALLCSSVPCIPRLKLQRNARDASGSSSKRWQTRQEGDKFAKEAKLKGLKSRAAFKLLEVAEP